MSVADFTRIMTALDDYRRDTGRPTLALGGWESEDPDIVPPPSLVEALLQISARLHTYTYIRELHRAKSAAAQVLSYGVRIDGKLPEAMNVAIVPNSTQALLLTLAALKSRGVAHVVIAAPGYFAAAEACRYLGIASTIIPAADFVTGAFDTGALLAAMRSPGAALLLTNPAYSIGVEYSWENLHSLMSALPEEAFVILDETRLGLNWNDEAPWYSADYPDRIAVIRSPSKIFFINGQKTSIIFGSSPLIQSIEQISEALLGSVAGVSEQVAEAYLQCWEQWVNELRAGEVGPLRQWRRQIIATLARNQRMVARRLQPSGFVLSPVNSGPYLLAGIRLTRGHSLDSYAAAREEGVLLMDSSYFLHQHSHWYGFRVNLSGEERHLAMAISRIFPKEQKSSMALSQTPQRQAPRSHPLTHTIEPLPLPSELYIESTTRCNEFCDQCPRTHLGREADRDVTLAEVQRIVEQFPKLDRVVLHGLGEPLLNTELPKIITYLRSRGVYTLFNSNALLLNERRGRSLIESGLSELRVSLDGATPATYARVRGVNQKALPLIVGNLAKFSALKTMLGAERPKVSLWFTAMRENFRELPEVVEIASRTGVPEVYVQRFIYFGKGLATEDQTLFHSIREEERETLLAAEARCRELGIAFTATGATEPVAYLGRTTGPELQPWKGCQRPYKLAYITAHGNVYSCCFAPFTPGPLSQKWLGNAFETPFERIWNGERYQEFRAAFESDTPWPQCAACGTKWSL